MTAEEEKVWNLVHEFCEKLYMDIPDMARRYLMDKIYEYASQQREEGIREGFEAARVVKSHNIDGDKERVYAILALWNISLAEYPTADDYLNQK